MCFFLSGCKNFIIWREFSFKKNLLFHNFLEKCDRREKMKLIVYRRVVEYGGKGFNYDFAGRYERIRVGFYLRKRAVNIFESPKLNFNSEFIKTSVIFRLNSKFFKIFPIFNNCWFVFDKKAILSVFDGKLFKIYSIMRSRKFWSTKNGSKRWKRKKLPKLNIPKGPKSI